MSLCIAVLTISENTVSKELLQIYMILKWQNMLHQKHPLPLFITQHECNSHIYLNAVFFEGIQTLHHHVTCYDSSRSITFSQSVTKVNIGSVMHSFIQHYFRNYNKYFQQRKIVEITNLQIGTNLCFIFHLRLSM